MLNVENYKKPIAIIPKATITNWAGFTNQPAGDGVEIVSDSASDVGPCTIWGTDSVTGALCYETVTLLGTGVASTVKTTWANIYGVFLGLPNGKGIVRAVGTITIREASGNAAITTIAAAAFHAGMLNLYIPGCDATILSASGTFYWKSFLPVATSLIGVEMVGDLSIDLRVTDYLSIIGDNTGASVQVVVQET